MKKAVIPGDAARRIDERRERGCFLVAQRAPHGRGGRRFHDRSGFALWPQESGTPRVGHQLLMLVGFGGQKRLPLSLLLGQRRGVRVRGLFDRAHRVVQRARPVARLEREALLACDLRLVQPLERIGEFPVVSFKDRPRGIRHLFAHQCAARADKGISAADMTLQEREGQARIDRLHPEAQLADLDRQRIPVDAVDALPDDVAECAPIVVRRWRAAGPDARDAISEATRSREQEVSRPARGVDDCQIEKGIGGMLGMSVDGALDHRIESARK